MKRRYLSGKQVFGLFPLLALLFLPGHTGSAKIRPEKKLAPGYGELNFAVPKPGAYQLPNLGLPADAEVIESNGQTTTLHKLMGNGAGAGKVVLLSFIYSTCSDINGCPLATTVLHQIKNRLAKEPETAGKLRLLTISFNPVHDTPERMKAYGASLQGEGVDWRFLTTRSEQALQPILQAYKQTVEKIYDSKGRFTNTFSHNLRVYLIDRHRQIRNIYNTELLHADMVIADIKTLLLETDIKAAQRTAARPESGESLRTCSRSLRTAVSCGRTERLNRSLHGVNEDFEHRLTANGSGAVDLEQVLSPEQPVKPGLYSAGDNKLNYENLNYITRSAAILERQGKPADLLKTVKRPPLGLPQVPVPGDNPVTAEKINLGRKLFYDRRLSFNNTFSCAMCHIPEQGFTSNEMATAVGVEGRTVRRNSPALYNAAYQKSLFHDGREFTLEQQVWGPLLAHNEMANPSVGHVIDKIKQNKDYRGLFEQAFGKPPGMETVGMALASYERALNSGNSPFDHWYFGNDKSALSLKAQHGFRLFTGKAGCSRCHSIEKDYALFTDNGLHNTGVGYAAAMNKPEKSSQRVQVAPGVYVETPSSVIAAVAGPKANDLGRYEITQNPNDRWRYKTPSLRNIGLTAPYMHDGSIAGLREVVEFYNKGGIANENLDAFVTPLGLTTEEIEDLVEFLNNLTGDNTGELISDAFAAPIGDNE